MSYSDLPLVHQILDEESIRAALLCNRKVQEIEPDHRLQNWQKWLQEREKINARLSKKVNRHPCELIANYGESLNTIKNDKLVLEYTQIPYPHDKYRGNPSFFEPPVALQRRHPYDPDYFAIKTKQETHLIPEVEYVSVPKCVQKEKKLSCSGYRNAKDVWLGSAYRKERIQKLNEQLKIIEPFKPQMEDLCTMGKSLKMSPKWSISVFKPAMSVLDDFQIVYTPRPLTKGDTAITPRAAKYNKHQNEEFVSLNGVRLCPHGKTTHRHIYLDFDYDISTGEPLTKIIEIKNGTSIALRYYFTQSSKYRLFADIVENDDEQVFFFDKRINIMLPNETKTFNIHFKTSVSSYYTSTLQFHLIPKIFRKNMFVNLTASSTDEDLTEKIEMLKEYVNTKVKNSSIYSIIEEVLEHVPKSHSNITLYTYDRGYIFESVNQQFSPTVRRPRYIYNKDVVDELETFYTKVKFEGCPPYWNYNIENIKKITRKREKLNRQKAALDQIYLMKLEDMQRRKLLGQEIDEEVECITKKGTENTYDKELPFSERLESTIKNLKEIISNRKEEEDTLTTQLENILLKLDTTCYSINHMCDSYEYVYAILCIAFDRIIFDVENIKDIMQIKTVDHYPSDLKRFPFQSTYKEVFIDEYYPKHSKIEEDFTQKGTSASELLKDVPHEDVKARHVAYFGEQETVDAKGKKGKNDKKKKKLDKKDKGKKSKKGAKNAKSQKAERPSTPQVDLRPISDFQDPFIPCTEYLSTSTSSSQQPEEPAPSGNIGCHFEEYKLNLYQIFYKHLSQAVMRITDVIETSKPRKLKLAEFNTIWQKKMVTVPTVKLRYIDIKKTLCRVIGIKMKKNKQSQKKKRKKKPKTIKLTEPLRPKEEGSLWSILRPSKRPQISQKPISYPELCLLVRKKNVEKKSIDVGTIMSACSGFDVNWEDFKDVSVQAESEHYHPSVLESKGVVSGIVQEMVSEVCDKQSVGEDSESIEMLTEVSGEEEEESDILFDEDFSDADLNLDVPDLYSPST